MQTESARLMNFLPSNFAVYIKRPSSLNEISDLLRIRLITSYLGEKSQLGWWQSDFFGASASSFLKPVFPKTQFLSQAEGSASAARKTHDERIGVGRVFHLFRLPEDFEQSFHRKLQESSVVEELTSYLTGKDAAIELLETSFGKPSASEVGPVLSLIHI